MEWVSFPAFSSPRWFAGFCWVGLHKFDPGSGWPTTGELLTEGKAYSTGIACDRIGQGGWEYDEWLKKLCPANTTEDERGKGTQDAKLVKLSN